MELKPILSAVVALWCSSALCADAAKPVMPTLITVKACDDHFVGATKSEACPAGKTGIVTWHCDKDDGWKEDKVYNLAACKDAPKPKK